jgi:DNA-binding XRE family transcriptional regulator
MSLREEEKMNFKDYAEENGLKTSFLCKKLGVSRQTLYRINIGEPVSPELADRIKKVLSPEIEVRVSKASGSHIRRRKTPLCVS